MSKRVCRVISSDDEEDNVNTPREKHKKRLQEMANKVNQVSKILYQINIVPRYPERYR